MALHQAWPCHPHQRRQQWREQLQHRQQVLQYPRNLSRCSNSMTHQCGWQPLLQRKGQLRNARQLLLRPMERQHPQPARPVACKQQQGQLREASRRNCMISPRTQLPQQLLLLPDQGMYLLAEAGPPRLGA